ncbi:MAG TPA: NAD(P)/FAD-dependent oxidoreductase [Dehalococcoidia bacterium]|nr:NAD(P)/FAD-dependent oxidoreductase [Dehalococcoidia bacterium]
MIDVIVVGGGPAGSRTAYMLARLGWGVTVLEKEGAVGNKSCCTGIIGQECVRSFDIDESVILRKVKGARLFSPTGKMLYITRDEDQASILDRVAFDMAMARRAQNAGAQYIFDSAVHDIRITKEGVELYCERRGGRLIARTVVIASGCGTRLTEKLGFGKAADFVAGAQADVVTKGQDEVEVYFGQEVAPGFFGWLVPTTAGNARVGLLSRHAPDKYLKGLLDSLVSGDKIVADGWKPSHGSIPLRPLRKTFGERILVVGDAAGQVKPTTGGGIYYGMLCADIAAGELNRALHRDDLSARSLSQYDRQWRRKLGRELMVGYGARKLFERLSDQQIDRLFDIIEKNRIDVSLLKAKDVSFDWHSQAIMNLLRRAVVARIFGGIRLPFRSSKNI